MPFYVPLIAFAVFVLVVIGMIFLGFYLSDYYSKKMSAIASELGLDIFLRAKNLEDGFDGSARRHGYSKSVKERILADCRAALSQISRFADPLWVMTGTYNGVPVSVYTGQTSSGIEDRHIWTVVKAWFAKDLDMGLVVTQEGIMEKLMKLLEGTSDILTGNKRLDERALIRAKDTRAALKLLADHGFQDSLLRLLADGQVQTARVIDECVLSEELGVIHSMKKLKDRLERVTDCVRAAENDD